MAEISTIPFLNAQQVSLTGLAHAANIAPEAAQAMTRQMAIELMRQQSEQVQKTEKTANALAVHDGKEEGANTAFTDAREQRKQHNEAGDEAVPGRNPMVGNLLNVKV